MLEHSFNLSRCKISKLCREGFSNPKSSPYVRDLQLNSNISTIAAVGMKDNTGPPCSTQHYIFCVSPKASCSFSSAAVFQCAHKLIYPDRIFAFLSSLATNEYFSLHSFRLSRPRRAAKAVRGRLATAANSSSSSRVVSVASSTPTPTTPPSAEAFRTRTETTTSSEYHKTAGIRTPSSGKPRELFFLILALIAAISSQMAWLGYLFTVVFPSTLYRAVIRERGDISHS